MSSGIERRLARLEAALSPGDIDLSGMSIEEIRELEYLHGIRCRDCDCELPYVARFEVGQQHIGPGLKLDYHQSWAEVESEEVASELARNPQAI